MNTKVIHIDSNPTNVVTADVGTLFIREGNVFFIRDSQGRVTKLQTQYRPKDYNRAAYKHSLNIYNTPHEIWEKVSGNGTKTGWKFVAYKKYFTDALHVASTPVEPPTSSMRGYVDASDESFKIYLTNTGITTLDVSGSTSTLQFAWDSSENHFRIDNITGSIISDDRLNLEPMLSMSAGSIYDVGFSLFDGSTHRYFRPLIAYGEPYLATVLTPVNVTLVENDPQRIAITDGYTFDFEVKAQMYAPMAN